MLRRLPQVQRSALGEWKARREVRNVGPQNRGRLVKEYGAAAGKDRSANGVQAIGGRSLLVGAQPR